MPETKPRRLPRGISDSKPAGASGLPLHSPSGDEKTIKPRSLSFERGVRRTAEKIVVVGCGGVGKTELCSLMEHAGVVPFFIDLDEGSGELDVFRAEPTPQTFEELQSAIALAAEQNGVGALVIDSLTKAEELVVEYTLRTVPHEKGHEVKSIEGFGYGKGYVHVFEKFLLLLQSLDSVARQGIRVVAVCHDCVEKVPNPAGDDWLQYQPRLQSPPKVGKVRERVKEWCDHMFYLGFDTAIFNGKAQGSGTRTIYTTERPAYWAKSRRLDGTPIVFEKGKSTLWQKLFNLEE